MPSTFLLRVSALATLFATSTFATPLSLHPRVVAAISEWDYAGCYTEANNMRALTGNSYYDDLMTVEKCAAVCSRFKWFGVEYGRECYCGNVINTGSVVTQASECSFSCPGNAVENCGAGNRLDMYSSTVAPPNSASFSSLGCYTEGTNGRTLVEKDYSSDSMTIELCASTCEGYAYFGVEYYRECYCGNSLVGGSTPAPSTDCNHECMGDNSELCGGDWRLNLYQLGPTITPTISTTASTSSTTSPSTATQSSSSYTFQGCYTEATEQRALSMGAYFDNFMTVPKCAAACSGYTWFGVEYGRECYCGNTINKGSVPTDVSECSFTCPGDETTFCGAGNRLDMYHYGVASTSTSDSSTTSIESSTSFPTTSSTTIDTSSTTISSISSDSSTTSSESATSTTLTPSASSSESSTIASSTESSSSTSSGSLSTSTSASSSSSSSSSSSTSSTSATSSSTSSSSSIPTTSTTTSSSQSSTITTFSTSTSQSSSSSSTSTT
ncbi:WSC domain-containing protein [Halenospora varia]|nr:WSC domain-containing protein [Halenospora varia]